MCELPSLRLPRDCLEKLVCSDCNGFLSSGPVKLKLDGGSLCGKCAKNAIFSPPLLSHRAFDEIVKIFTFPCKFESLGCHEFIGFDDPTNHEDMCHFKLHFCPTDSTCDWTGTLAQIPQHYRHTHANLVMEKPSFEIKVRGDFEEVRLFITYGFLFLVKVKTSQTEGKIWIRLEHLSLPNEGVKYKLILHTGLSDDLQMMLKEHKTQKLNMDVFNKTNSQCIDAKSLLTLLEEPTNVYCKIFYDIPGELIKETKLKLTGIKCPHCGIFMAPPIYKCHDGHLNCVDCLGYRNKCKTCQKDEFHRQIDLEVMSATHQLNCRWLKCNGVFNSSEIRKHERTCQHKVYKCPRCYKWRGSYKKTLKHFAEMHDTHPVHETNEVAIPVVVRVYDFYVFSYGEIFGCSIFPTDDYGKNVSVWYYGAPSFHDNFDYFVHLKCIIRNEEKIYQMQKCCPFDDCYSYNLKIPNEDLEHFNYPEDYEILLKIIENKK